MFESITISFEGDDNMSVNIMRILSLYLASLRCQKKLKPSEICEKTGIHIKNLNNIETGKTTLANRTKSIKKKETNLLVSFCFCKRFFRILQYLSASAAVCEHV